MSVLRAHSAYMTVLVTCTGSDGPLSMASADVATNEQHRSSLYQGMAMHAPLVHRLQRPCFRVESTAQRRLAVR